MAKAISIPASGNAEKTQRHDNLLIRVLHGRIISIDFFRSHWKSLVLIIIMILVYITNRYQCLTKMEEIRRLEQQLEIVETERIRAKSEYMSRIRESSMQELVDTMHLGLKVQNQPPYRLPAR